MLTACLCVSSPKRFPDAKYEIDIAYKTLNAPTGLRYHSAVRDMRRKCAGGERKFRGKWSVLYWRIE